MGDTAAQATETTTPKPAAAVPDRAARDGESITAKMERLGWDKEAKHDENPETLGAKARAQREAKPRKGVRPTAEVAAPESEATEEPGAEPSEAAKSEPEATKAAEAENPKIAQLKALIAELGYALEDGRVTTKERAEIRIARNQLREEQRRLEQEAMGRIEAATKSLEEREKGLSPREAKLAEFDAAVSAGDHEQIAKLAGFETWDKFQEHIIALKADPAYVRLRKLEQELGERTRREKEAADKAEAERVEREAKEAQQAQERQRIEAQQNYIKNTLVPEMTASSNPLIKALADDPGFVQAMFRIKQAKYDRTSDTTVSVEEALKLIPPGGSQPLDAELRKLWERLNPYFSAAGYAATTEKPKAVAGAPKQRVEQRPNRTPQPVTPPPARPERFDDQAWKRKAAQRLEEAVREEAAERKRTGTR